MVRIFVIVGLFCICSAVAAESGEQEINCEQYFDLGKKIMEGRQAGVPMPDMIKIAGDNAFFRAMVITAYERGRYSTEKYQNRAISDFANEIYMVCVKGSSG